MYSLMWVAPPPGVGGSIGDASTWGDTTLDYFQLYASISFQKISPPPETTLEEWLWLGYSSCPNLRNVCR